MMYRRNIGKMIGICYRYTANRQLAEDLAHDAFLKAIDKASSFKGEGVFEGWLRRVVVNHVLSYIREQKRQRRIDDWLRCESNVVDPDENSMITDPPEVAQFSEHELLNVINDLPAHHRLVFNLYVIDNFTHAQIAAELGISEGTSKSHLARARKGIRQRLAEKVEAKPGRRRTFLFFLFPYNAWSIDRLYNKRFSCFELADRKALPGFDNAASLSASVPYAGASWIIIAAACVAGGLIILSAIIYSTPWENKMHSLEDDLTHSLLEDSTNTEISREQEAKGIAVDQKNNLKKADSGAATLRRNGVIGSKTIKTSHMKALDSLGIALLTSAGLAFDSAAQPTVKMNTLSLAETHSVAQENDPVDGTSVVQFSAPAGVKEGGKQEGTFYATSLYWSAENHELYFNGKVKVDVGENDFVSSGSVTFLGKVYLLIIDDNPIKLDSKINLSQREYRLTQLDSGQATKKYGSTGENGAVEIHVME